MGKFKAIRTIDTHTEDGDVIEIGLSDFHGTVPEWRKCVSLHVSNGGNAILSTEDLETLRDAIDVALLSIKRDF